jgi:hypothetical protein
MLALRPGVGLQPASCAGMLYSKSDTEGISVGAETSTEARISRDFFISYTGANEKWAEWIAWSLEEAGYTTVVQLWDFGAGSRFVTEMHRATQIADRTIAVLSNLNRSGALRAGY